MRGGGMQTAKRAQHYYPYPFPKQTAPGVPLRWTIVIRTHHIHKNLYISVSSLSTLGSDYSRSFVTVSGLQSYLSQARVYG